MSSLMPKAELAPGLESLFGPSPRKSKDAATDAVQIEIALGKVEDGDVLRLYGLFATHKVPFSKERFFGKPLSCRIEFGITGGDLKIFLKRAVAPITGRYRQRVAEMATAQAKAVTEVSTESGLKIGFGEELGLSLEDKQSEKAGREQGWEYAQSTFHAHGSDDCPIWTFASPDMARPLIGSLPGDDPPLVRLIAEGDPIEAFAVFMVRRRDLLIRDILPDEFLGEVGSKLRAVAIKALPEALWRLSGVEADGELMLAFSTDFAEGLKVADQPAPVEGGHD